MRTTVTLADDVAAELERIRRDRSIGLSAALNELARAGMAYKSAPRRPFIQRTRNIGLRIDVTNVAEALEQIEAPDYR